MQRQPLLRLLDAVVMKLVVHLPPAQRFEQIASHSIWKLAVVNGYADNTGHAGVVADFLRRDKPQASLVRRPVLLILIVARVA